MKKVKPNEATEDDSNIATDVILDFYKGCEIRGKSVYVYRKLLYVAMVVKTENQYFKGALLRCEKSPDGRILSVKEEFFLPPALSEKNAKLFINRRVDSYNRRLEIDIPRVKYDPRRKPQEYKIDTDNDKASRITEEIEDDSSPIKINSFIICNNGNIQLNLNRKPESKHIRLTAEMFAMLSDSVKHAKKQQFQDD